MSDHMLEVSDGGAYNLVCTAPVGAWCRMHCPNGCDEWGPDHDEYADHGTLTDYGTCLAVEWLDATSYEGYEDRPRYEPGPMRVFYEDGWLFEPIEAEVGR